MDANYSIVLTRQAHKQTRDIKAAGLDAKVRRLFDCMRADPLGEPPPFEALCGDLKGLYSRRINLHHRLVYDVDQKNRIIRILSMWTHYATLHEE